MSELHPLLAASTRVTAKANLPADKLRELLGLPDDARILSAGNVVADLEITWETDGTGAPMPQASRPRGRPRKTETTEPPPANTPAPATAPATPQPTPPVPPVDENDPMAEDPGMPQ
jgi:hypothetical protein